MINLGRNRNDSDQEAIMTSNPSKNSFMTHSCDGKFWDVPKTFTFPEKVTRKKAYEMWLHGFPGCTIKVDSDCMNCPVKPFRFVTPNKLPKKSCNAFEVSWRPILLKMSKAPDLVLLNSSDPVSS